MDASSYYIYSNPKHPYAGTRMIDVLKKDNNYRYHGVNDDLKVIDDVDFDNKDKDIKSYPIVNVSPYYKFYIANKKSLDIKKSLESKFEFLKALDFTNLVLAGGSIMRNIITDELEMINYVDYDLDFFIYGCNEATALETVKRLYRQIETFCQQNKQYEIKSVHKGEHVMSIYLFRKKNLVGLIQIIFRLYKTISEILHGFDMGSSAVAYNGTNVYMTTLSEYCYINMVNIADVTRRSTTFEKRLKKYYHKGFSIILPDFYKLKPDKHYKTKYFTINYGSFSCSNYDYISSDYMPRNAIRSVFDNIINGYNDPHNIFIRFNKYYFYKYLQDIINNVELRDDINIEQLQIKRALWYYNKEDIIRFINDEKFNPVCKIAHVNLLEHFEKYYQYALDNLFEIKFNVQSPGTQLTSSINPIIAHPIEWYESYYWENYVKMSPELTTTDLNLEIVNDHKPETKNKNPYPKPPNAEHGSDTDSDSNNNSDGDNNLNSSIDSNISNISDL